jgi:phenylpropionate dioxygenase-like ring-hydroxylating dioxygenase large terminal subunit
MTPLEISLNTLHGLRCNQIKVALWRTHLIADYAEVVRDDRVHGSLYSDQDVFADELDRIFRRGWVFVGHESEVPQPGDWVTRLIGAEPVIMVRGTDRVVRVLSNRCAHRGTALCWKETGHSRAFQCNYHGWTFGLDGSLRGVPYKAGFERERTELGLDRPRAVESYRGFVFANMSGDAGPLSDHLGNGGRELIDRLCDLSPTGNIRLNAGWIGHRIQSNWKMWPESDEDGYHVDFVHISMLRTTQSYYQDTIVGGEASNSSRAVDHGGGHSELDMRPGYKSELSWLGVTRDRVSEYCQAMVRRYGEERANQLLWEGPPHAFIFPNLFLGELNIARVQPLGVNLTVHYHTAVQFEGVDDQFNQRLLRQSEAALGPGSFIVADDAVTAERMQTAFAGATVGRSSNGWSGAWIDLSRGQKRERVDDQGRRIGHVSDEVTNRAFWRRYRQMMTAK